MDKLFPSFCAPSVPVIASPVFAKNHRICDIGAINTEADNLIYKGGRLSVFGYFNVSHHYSYNGPAPLCIDIGADSGSLNSVKFTRSGNNKNILNIKFGDIILISASETPRRDIEFPKPNYSITSKTIINRNPRMKQQSCILQ